MPRASKLVALAATALLTAGLAACSTTPATDAPAGEASGDFTPITIEHALGTIEITEKPERIATVNWANQEVPSRSASCPSAWLAQTSATTTATASSPG